MTQNDLVWRPKDALTGYELLTTPIMIADAELVIRFVNDAGMEMLQLIEPDVRKEMPNFRAHDVLDTPVDYFQNHPALKRAVMGDTETSHEGKFVVGGKKLRFRATPTWSEDGDLESVMIEWQDRAAMAENERQIAALISGVKVMAKDHRAGMISSMIDPSDMQGEYHDVAIQVNEMVQDHITTKKKIIACMNAFAQGEFDHPMEIFTGDRAFLTEAVEAARTAFKTVVGDIEDLSQSIEAGVLDRVIKPETYNGGFRKIIEAFDRSYISLNMTISDIKSQISEISGAIGEVNSSASQLSTASQTQASAVEEISATIEQTEQMVQASAEASNKMRDVVMVANGIVGEGIETVAEMTEAMHQIRSSSSEISKIIKVIDEIAFQTNLLALNAAVEAARAGEHGRGFAVVAQEVRNLAARSAKAAKETGDLIKVSGDSVQRGVKGSEATEQAFRRISEEVRDLEETAVRIATGAKEQSQGVSQISTAATALAKTGLDVSSQSEELASAAAQMEASATAVRNTMSRFSLRPVAKANDNMGFLNKLNAKQRDQIIAMLQEPRATAH